MFAPVSDVGPGLQSNFATVYYNDANGITQPDPKSEENYPYDLKVSERLLEDYERNYMKKFPFEKGQFHQCIPNPYRENEFITVMLVEKSLEYAGDDKPVDAVFK